MVIIVLNILPIGPIGPIDPFGPSLFKFNLFIILVVISVLAGLGAIFLVKSYLNRRTNKMRPETTKVIAYAHSDKVSPKSDAEGEFIDIDFDNLEVGKNYLVRYGKEKYIINKISDNSLSTSEVIDTK